MCLCDFAQLVATTAVWALHNALSNLSLAKNSVGLYQISKILVTPLIVAIEFAVYGKLPPPRLALPLLGACAGVALATVSDVSFTTRGALCAGASACASSILKVLQQDLLQRRRLSSLTLMRATWGPQTLLLLLSIPLLESHADALLAYQLDARRAAVLLLSAAAGFALNVSSLLAIKLTSAIAIVLLSQGKTVATMLGGYLFFDGQPNPRQLAGATIAIISIAAYSYGTSVAAGGEASSPAARGAGRSGAAEVRGARDDADEDETGDEAEEGSQLVRARS